MAEARERSAPAGAPAPRGPPPSGPVTLESLFADETGVPLADAFRGRRPVHNFVGMRPIDAGEVPALWAEIHDRPRSNPAVGYVHVPFCENHCLFCGFYQNPWREDKGAPYVDAVIAQLEAFSRRAAHEGPPLQAVYLGGGTPTALAGPDIVRLVTAIRRCLPLTPDCEITLEGRISTLDRDKALAAYDAGVTRISLGVQSFKEEVRRPQGRRAGTDELMRALAALVALDRGAVAIDLIYGLPRQIPEDIAEDMHRAADLGLDGVSLYSLHLIPGTPLLTAIEKGKMDPAPTTGLGDYLAAGEDAALSQGWEPISANHWRGSLRERSVYNIAAKVGHDCLPFGAGAAGFIGDLHYRIGTDLEAYQAAAGSDRPLTAGMARGSRLAPALNAVKSGMEFGRLDPRAVDRALAGLCGPDAPSFSDHAAPLIAQWTRAGLFEPFHRFHRLTRAGRFWQVAMTGRLINWLGQHPATGDLT
ncbi:heme anaerobic degradation radical SAM methyltransferase ChuW/HutW [Paracoccus sp. (in: a-proteobacteria)]|uniref:heme anaerobic degradation radical SAM methyltransferase ChuW/HutW n=1 Tax=Paracoccus sp. TaxID=267 RepID=UPI00321FF5BD